MQHFLFSCLQIRALLRRLKKEMLHDIATVTGAEVISEEKGMKTGKL